MKKLLAIVALVFIATSCIPNKDLIYFQGEASENKTLQKLQNEPYKFQVNDMIDIQLKSADKNLVALFLPSSNGNSNNSTLRYNEESIYFNAYSIDRHGNIRVPYIGAINVLGYTASEVREKIEKEFEVYFKNPEDVFITVKLAGIRFTVLGEVKTTGSMVLYLNQVNLVEALATAGDITVTGNRSKVTIFRKNIDGTKRYDINMLDINSFNSDSFYIQSNDIIYVEPLKQKSWGTGTSGMKTITSLIAVLSLVTTTILLINAL